MVTVLHYLMMKVVFIILEGLLSVINLLRGYCLQILNKYDKRLKIYAGFQGNCDAGKQYCCYNSQVAGSNKPRPSSFFGNTALHQHYARPEINQGAPPQNFNANLNRPVRGPGVLAGPGGPVDFPSGGSGSQIHPRKQSSSKLPFSNKLFPENN